MGMGGIAVGSFVQGASEGYDRARKRGIEDERQKWEREDQNDKQRMRDALAETQAKISKIRTDVANGKAPFQLADNPIGGGDEQGAQQPQGTEQTPVGTSTPDAAPTRQAIAAPTQGSAAPAQAPVAPEQKSSTGSPDPMRNFLFGDGTGKYKNQHEVNNYMWDNIKAAYGEYYEKTGQFDKRMELDEKINKWRDNAYDPLRKATGVAIMGGDPGAMKMLAHFSDVAETGIKVDPNSGTYDAKTQTWKGIAMVGMDGKKHVQDIPATQLTMLLSNLSPEKRAELQVAHMDKEREFGIKERQAKADETRAANSGIQARETSRLREIAQENQSDYRRSETERKREAQFTTELENDLFRGKDPAMMDDTQREMITRTGSLARNLYAIPGNQKNNAATLAGVARGLGTGKARLTELPSTAPQEQRDNYYLADYAGAKVLVPRSLISQNK